MSRAALPQGPRRRSTDGEGGLVDGIIRASLRHRLLVVCAALGLLVWGGYEAAHMPVDVFPDLTAPTVTIVAEAHGMATEEVETLLTFPIETALNGAAGVRRVRSQTSVGLAVIWVDFAWGTDILAARQVVGERLDGVRGGLPTHVAPPVMGPITSIMGDILFVGLTGDGHSPMDLRTLADRRIARRLLAVPGVAQVITIGGDRRQYQVLLAPRRLDAFELTADDVAHALETANENTSAGFLIEGGSEHLIRGVGRVRGPEDIAATLVTMRGGLPVTVGDLGEVTIGAALKRGDAGVNGAPGVVIGLRKQPQANTLELTREVEAVLAELERSLPDGVALHGGLFRQADFIQVAVDNVTAALRDGAILVVLIVLAFLMSVRATIITALAIPLSILTAIGAMKWQGIEINTMTLGGLAIAVGALVDDAIIDVENVTRRLGLELSREGHRRGVLSVVFDASKEIRRSIVFATLIIVLVFLPLFFLSGVEGRLLRPLGFAYVVALGASLLVALTITPVLCSLLLPHSRHVASARESALVRLLKAAYAPVLRWLLPLWPVLSAASLAALVAAGVHLAHAGRAFLPAFNEGALTLGVVSAPGTSLDAASALGRQVEQILLSHPEVAATARRTGRAEGDEHSQPASASEVDARLRPEVRDRDAFLAEVRADLAAVPGVQVIIGQPIEHRIDHMLSGTRASIAVKLFGPDLGTLRRLAEQVEARMKGIRGVVDLFIEQQPDLPQVSVRFRRAAIARHGLTIEQVAHEIETAFGGRVVTQVLEEQLSDGCGGACPPASTDLVVRYDAAAMDSFEAVREAHVGTPAGARLPLHVLADVERATGPSGVARENVERKVVVQCNVADRDLSSVVDEIRDAVAPLDLPSGYRVAYGGQFESAAQASRVLLAVGAAVLVGILVLLLVALGSLRDALLVLLNLPLALIGGVVGVHLSGDVVSVASIIGFITLFGIATRNGIMMITHFHHLASAEGVTEPVALVTRGALERLSPILMTALASGLGLLPLALAGGQPGSEIQSPMAVVILCGLVTSTALNMILVPALYLRFGDVTRRLRAR